MHGRGELVGKRQTTFAAYDYHDALQEATDLDWPACQLESCAGACRSRGLITCAEVRDTPAGNSRNTVRLESRDMIHKGRSELLRTAGPAARVMFPTTSDKTVAGGR